MVYHVMKDGSVKTDITGHVVKIKDAEPLYQLMANMSGSTIKRKRKRG